MNEWIKRLLENQKESVMNKPYVYGFWGIVIALFVPIFIWTLYFIGDCGYVLIYTSLSVGDALGFYGSFLTFLGTVALSALALWQSYQYRLKDDEYRKLIDKIEHDKHMPKIYCRITLQNGRGMNIKFEAENISDNYAYDIVVSDFTVLSGEEKIVSSKSGTRNIGSIPPHGKIEIAFTNEPFMSSDISVPTELSFYIDYEDKFNVQHKCLISGISTHKESFMAIMKTTEMDVLTDT